MVKEENIVYIGKKPFMNYVTAVMMQFKEGSADEVLIRARGKTITKAIDVGLVVTERFLEGNVNIDDVKLESENIEEDGKETRVSCIDVLLRKKSK